MKAPSVFDTSLFGTSKPSTKPNLKTSKEVIDVNQLLLQGNDGYLKAPDAARYMGCSASFLRRLVKLGLLKCARLGPRMTLFKKSHLDDLFNRHSR